MAVWSYSGITSLVTPGGTITFNAAAADTLFLDPGQCRGLGEFSARAPVDPKGQTDGYILHPFYLPGVELVLGGWFHIVSSTTEAGYVTARDALMDTTYASAKSAAAVSTSTLNFTSGSIAGLKVRRYAPMAISVSVKGFMLELVGTALS